MVQSQFTKQEATWVKKSETVVLIAEDEPIVRNVVCAIIRDEGYTFLVAADGEEALSLGNKLLDSLSV